MKLAIKIPLIIILGVIFIFIIIQWVGLNNTIKACKAEHGQNNYYMETNRNGTLLDQWFKPNCIYYPRNEALVQQGYFGRVEGLKDFNLSNGG